MKHYTTNSNGIISINMESFIIDKSFNWQTYTEQIEKAYDSRAKKEDLEIRLKHIDKMIKECFIDKTKHKETYERKKADLIRKIIYFTYNELLYYSACDVHMGSKSRYKENELSDLKNISAEDLQEFINKNGIAHKHLFVSFEEKEPDTILHEIVDERLIRDI